jgi:ferredoxin
MAKKVQIDEDECIGCESCVEICPEVFGFNDDTTKAYVLDEDKGDVECVEEAVASCPTDCIEVDE